MKNDEITVLVMTYNHKDYIVQAIQSILEQEIDVGYHILVHDDCSDDGTYELLLNLQKSNKDKISIIRQDTRKFPVDGFNRMLFKYVVPRLTTRFVAYCDGDDYWIDKNKLKKQYEFMNNHNEYSLCFHSAYQLRNNSDISSKWFIKPTRDYDLSDFINDKSGICVATSSIFVRREVFIDFPNWRINYPVEDVPLLIHAALKGKIHGLADIMCVYRQFAAGSWSLQNKNNDERIIRHLNEMHEAIECFDSETDYKYHDMVLRQIDNYNFRIALLTKNYQFVFEKKNRTLLKRLGLKERFSLFLQYKMPRFYSVLKQSKK